MSYFTLKNGEKLYYEDMGSGKRTIVMLHGWTTSHEVFDPVKEEISKNARCIIYDHRGHGKSKEANSEEVTLDTLASDLYEIIKGLDLEDITLLGWSMGAAVVMNYTLLYGCEELRDIILCDMTPKQINDEKWKLGLYQGKYTIEDMERDAGKEFFDLYYQFVTGAVPRLAKIPQILLNIPLKAELSKCDEEVLKSLSRSMKQRDLRKCVGNISVPVTYFYPMPGSLFSPELAGWYEEHVNTPFHAVQFEDCSHMMIEDQPEKFTEEVIKVLQK